MTTDIPLLKIFHVCFGEIECSNLIHFPDVHKGWRKAGVGKDGNQEHNLRLPCGQ